jgi:hypothetical protein
MASAPAGDGIGGLCDRLEALREAIGDSPAFRVVGFEQGTDEPEWVYARFDDEGQSLFAECYGVDAAALIVAAVNALGTLTAIARTAQSVRTALDQWGDDLTTAQVRALRAALADDGQA